MKRIIRSLIERFLLKRIEVFHVTTVVDPHIMEWEVAKPGAIDHVKRELVHKLADDLMTSGKITFEQKDTDEFMGMRITAHINVVN